MDGVTASTTELNYLDITTLGTSEASKVVTADSNGDVTITDGAHDFNIASHDGNNGLTLGGTLVQSSATDLNLVNGASTGTIVNSKAVIYGSSGEVNATTLQISGTSITASATELNTLNNVTGGTVTESKAVVVDSNKDIGDFRNLTATTLTGTLQTGAQSNITSVGTLTGLTVDGDVTLDASDVDICGNVTVDGSLMVNGGIAMSGDFSFFGTDNSFNVVCDEIMLDASDVDVCGNLTVNGDIILNGSLTTVAGDLNISGGYHGKRRVVDLTAANASPTQTQSGTLFTFGGTACEVTLPPAESGLEYFFVVNTTQTGDAVITTDTNDKISGCLLKTTDAFNETNLANTTTVIDAIPATTNRLTFNGTTSGGVIGSYIHIVGMGANKYHVNGTVIGSGTLVTSAS